MPHEPQILKLHDDLLVLLKDFHDFCMQNNIKYSLHGGTLLGAIREKGFIPWDDDVDVYEIIKICNMHPRVNILQPGPGVGGHCISVDPWFLVGDYPALTQVIGEAMKTNADMPEFVLNRIFEIMKDIGLSDITRVGLYGLTYKENVDDCRESPTLQLIESQKRHLAAPLKVYDPFISDDITENQYHDLDQFLNDVDMVVIMVGHNEIKKNVDKLDGKIILDTRNICRFGEVYRL